MLYSNKRNESKTLYSHFQSDVGGGYTVGWREIGDNVVYAVSVCSEKDQFVKKIGREFVDIRLDSVSLSEDGSVLIPEETVKFIEVVSLEEIKAYLNATAFSEVTYKVKEDLINSLTLKDLSYMTFIDIFDEISLGNFFKY